MRAAALVALLAFPASTTGCFDADAAPPHHARDGGAPRDLTARDLAPSRTVRRELGLEWGLNELRLATLTAERDRFAKAVDQLAAKRKELARQLKEESAIDMLATPADSFDPDTFEIRRATR